MKFISKKYDYVYLGYDNESEAPENNKLVVFIDNEVFSLVSNVVELFEPIWRAESQEILWWHDSQTRERIVDNLSKFYGFSAGEVSKVLSAMGY